jgi:hypothetical protein
MLSIRLATEYAGSPHPDGQVREPARSASPQPPFFCSCGLMANRAANKTLTHVKGTKLRRRYYESRNEAPDVVLGFVVASTYEAQRLRRKTGVVVRPRPVVRAVTPGSVPRVTACVLEPHESWWSGQSGGPPLVGLGSPLSMRMIKEEQTWLRKRHLT